MLKQMQSRPLSRLVSNPLSYVFLLAVCLIYFMRHSVPQVSKAQEWLQQYKEGHFSQAESLIQSASQHPIRALARQKKQEFKDMIERQSRDLPAAKEEYIRRYHRTPPPGFDKWFAYAEKHDSIIIDDFDIIHNALEPFWQVEPKRLRTMIDQIAPLDEQRLWNTSIENGKFVVPEDAWMGTRIAEFLKDVEQDLPDMLMIINPLDEPRVVIDRHGRDIGEVTFTDKSEKPIWKLATKPCKGLGAEDRKQTPSSVDRHGLHFVANMDETKDVCRNPNYERLHGMFMAPTSFIYTTQPVPIFSQSKPSTFGDIPYPSMWYWDHEDTELEDHDPIWADKKRTVYWAGSTTGGYMDTNKPMQHRQRFVKLAEHLGSAGATFLTESRPGVWETYKSADILTELYDAKFTQILQCEETECEKEKAYFGLGEHEDASMAYKSRFIMDLDGNSFSGRFYNLLASHSAVLKQTIFQEWHDERLFPWVHYVPVSLEMDELPETLRYLALTEEGDGIARNIAQTGREWNRKFLRRQDASVFLYRVLLEYARILDDERVETRLSSP